MVIETELCFKFFGVKITCCCVLSGDQLNLIHGDNLSHKHDIHKFLMYLISSSFFSQIFWQDLLEKEQQQSPLMFFSSFQEMASHFCELFTGIFIILIRTWTLRFFNYHEERFLLCRVEVCFCWSCFRWLIRDYQNIIIYYDLCSNIWFQRLLCFGMIMFFIISYPF